MSRTGEYRLVSDRVLEMREKNTHMNQKTAAEAMHIDKQTIYRYEYGNPAPCWASVKMLALIYGTNVEYLTGKSDDPAPDDVLVPANKQILDHYNSLFQRLSIDDRALIISMMERLVQKESDLEPDIRRKDMPHKERVNMSKNDLMKHFNKRVLEIQEEMAGLINNLYENG